MDVEEMIWGMQRDDMWGASVGDISRFDDFYDWIFIYDLIFLD